jgi:hypothetical protein
VGSARGFETRESIPGIGALANAPALVGSARVGRKMEAFAMCPVRLSVAIFCILQTALCAGEAQVEVPPGVRYKTASTEVNDRAKKRLAEFFSTPMKLEIPDDAFAAMAICGPLLWSRIKGLAEMKALTKGEVVVHMPIYEGGNVVRQQQMQGKLFQNKAEIREFWKALCKTVGRDEKFRIRRPTKLELELYWAMIPYDIEEPIFVVESDRHSFLIDFAGGKDRMFWIDDLRGATFLPSEEVGVSK